MPLVKKILDRFDHVIDGWKISVVCCHTTSEFPNSLNGIQIRAIWRQEQQIEPGLRCFSPLFVQNSMMISNVICNHDHLPPRARTDIPEMPQERKTSLGIKTIGFPFIDQLSIMQTYCSKISDTFTCRMMQKHRITRLRRNPHPASRPVLLEMNLIHRPKINAVIFCQPSEFFLPALVPQRLLLRLKALASLVLLCHKMMDLAG